MRKKIARNLAIINCLLLTLPGLASAEESGAEASDVYTLDEVVVTAVPLDKYLVTTSVITDKDIEAKGAENLAEVLEDVPGVHIHRGKKNNNTLDIRGSSISYTKIYIDGVLVNPLAKVSGDLDLNMFPVDNIAKIEVIKGPAPVSYGTDAIGGIILITTKSGKAYQGGKVSLSGGSDETRNASVSYGNGDDKFNYYINAGTEHTDGFMDNAFRKSNYFNAKLNWRLKDNATLSFTGGYSSTDKGALNPIDPATKAPIWYTTGFWRNMNDWQIRDWDKTDLSLTYTEKVNDILDYNVKVYRFTEDNALWAYGPNWRGTGSSSGYDTSRWNASYWESTLNGAEFQGNLKINDSHTLSFGTLYNDIDWKKSDSPNSDPYNFSWNKYNNKRYGYYLQDHIFADDKTTITLGVRHDRSEVTDFPNNKIKNYSATNPTINLVYQLDDRNTMRASFGKTISFPTVSQLYSSSGGNPDLEPERAKNYELGWKHQFDDSLTGDIAIFKNDITNMIDRTTIGGVTKYRNSLYTKIEGVELELNKKFDDRFDGYLSYTYLDTKTLRNIADNTFVVEDQKNVPQHNINYGLTYKPGKGYKVSLSGHIISERATWDDGTGDTSTTVVPTLGSYHVANFLIKREINDKQEWYVNVYNIFDKDYQDELYFPGEGRTIIVGLDYKF